MHFDGFLFATDSVTKFFNSLRVYGWFHHPDDYLKGVQLIDSDTVHSITRVGVEHGGVKELGPNKGFEIQAFRKSEYLSDDIEVEFITHRGHRIRVKLFDLCKDRISAYPGPKMEERFVEVCQKENYSILDIGGRSRSRKDRSKDFNLDDYVVLDILPGENVDIVGDAHCLSKYFPEDRFDAFYSVSVFEHIMMPWAVVPQINAVLKTGGIGLISTHQTLGMHDIPWDFWRFSDTAWDALFNKVTGFEIVERTLDFEQYILPFIYRPSKAHAEKSAGFEGSAVWVKKIGPCRLEWPIAPSDLTKTMYPDHDDNFRPDGFGGLV